MIKSYRDYIDQPIQRNMLEYQSNSISVIVRKTVMRYCDLNEDILYWASEELPVRYYNLLDKKYHRYFPDFVVKTSNNDKYMIEIKPSRQRCQNRNHQKRKQNRICENHLNISKIKL